MGKSIPLCNSKAVRCLILPDALLFYVIVFHTKLMHIWSLSLCLALSYFTRSVSSRQCYDDQQCDQGKVCCGSICASRRICGRPCVSDTDCSYGDECNSGSCQTPTSAPATIPDFNYPTFHFPTFKQFTVPPPDYDYCIWDSDCDGSSTCEDGNCVEEDRDEGAFSWSGSKVIGIVFFVAVATVISCVYHVCKRSRKPPTLATQNAPPTGVSRDATNTTRSTEHELQPGIGNAAVAATVVAVEVNDDVPLPPGAPPPYSSLEFERQQQYENGEPEQPPPSYDEAVRNSTMALV